jgi:uncharacterized protein (UPF0303 family)
MTAPSLDDLQTEAKSLILPRFAEAEALALGQILQALALGRGLALVVNIRTANRTLFHAALPGSAAMHERWALRKSNTAFFFQEASLLVGTRHRDKGENLVKHGLDAADYADHGGAVPIRVQGVGLVAVATVSGLPQVDDHRLVVEGLRALLATL